MHNILKQRLLQLAIVTIAIITASSAFAKETIIKVMTYNLRAGSLSTLDSIANVINSANADFVALQEVDVRTYRNNAPNMNGKDMITELASRTNMFGFFAKTLDFADGYYGIAILSKYPAISMERFLLPNPQATEQRALLKGLFDMDGNKQIIFACTHLDVKDYDTRTLQADYILNKLKTDSIPTILGGDFNATPNDLSIKWLEEKMDNISGDGKTFPADKPNRKIDYIMIAPQNCYKSFTATVINSPQQQSDHRAVVSEIRLK